MNEHIDNLIHRASWHFRKAKIHNENAARLALGPVEYQAGTFPVTCSCGKEHNFTAWKALRLDGFFEAVIHGRRFSHDLEHRTCLNCKSTMSAKLL